MPKVSIWLIFTQKQYTLLILNVKQSMCLKKEYRPLLPTLASTERQIILSQ